MKMKTPHVKIWDAAKPEPRRNLETLNAYVRK